MISFPNCSLAHTLNKCSNEQNLSILQIQQLRRELREKFPAAHRAPHPPASLPPAPLTFAPGHLSEMISPHQSSGASLVISKLLDKKRETPLVLIDGRDSFDPASYGNEKCHNLIWIRCSKSEQAIQAADLLLRDGNLPFIILDLHLVAERELRRIPHALWQRLKVHARHSGSTMLAITPHALVPTPHRRLTLSGHFSLAQLELEEPSLQLHHSLEHQHTHKA